MFCRLNRKLSRNGLPLSRRSEEINCDLLEAADLWPTTEAAGTARGLCGISHLSTVGQCYLLIHSAPSRIFISYRENLLETDGASIAGTRSHA